jgi:2-succinyl-5-enolpyruvyl-6-hydroxy-3-cyclohexene-1-carboxylate synthase
VDAAAGRLQGRRREQKPVNAATDTAVAVVEALWRGGVREVVLAPGSRSASLALAVHEADRRALMRLHVRIDERTAGFLALGLARGSHRPVAVVTTSGTAVANLAPAVLEARHSGVPLLVLSADRPAALRGTGANQTTDQVGIFGPHIVSVDVAPGDDRAAAEAVAAAVRRPAPTQVNLQFADPLLPPALPVALEARSPVGEGFVDPAPPADRITLDPQPRTVLVAGDDAGPPARLLAEEAGWPLLAEPTSGARTGTHAIRTYRLLLGGPLAAKVERVVVAGHPTLSRPVTRLISSPDVEVLSVAGPAGTCTDPGRVARHLPAIPAVSGPADPAWLDEWRAADALLAAAVDDLAASDAGLPLRVAAEVAAAVPPGGLLVVGSSQPVRDLDVMGRPYQAGQRRLVIGNRGLSGIDGTVSTAVGAALGRRSARALAYVGDLTFLHDANGLVIGPDEPRPDLTIVVANDDGGAIFATLEQGAPAYAEAYERVFGTPHGVALEEWCAATGTAYRRADDDAALREALAEEQHGIRVVEVPVDRGGRRALDQALRGLVG